MKFIARANGTTSSAIAGTDRALTFSGQANVTIAPGAEVESDPVSVAIEPLADYAVSIYFPTPSAVTNDTIHQNGNQSSYIAAGDVSAWSTGATGVPASELTFQADGNLVEYDERQGTLAKQLRRITRS